MTSRDSLPRALILQHDLFLKTLDNHLLRCPVSSSPVNRVLDIGTGCGIWAADFAAAHASAQVIGVDNFPQPKIVAPSNCRFLDLDAEQQSWDELADTKFDLIHTRLVPFHAAELPALLRRCYEHLAAGGWMEMQDVCPPCRTDEPPGAAEHQSKVVEWTNLRLMAAAKLGIDQGISARLPAMLREAGFVDVCAQEHKWPVGPWVNDKRLKEIGAMNLELLRLSMMGLSKELLANLGMGEEEVEEFVKGVKEELGVGGVYSSVRIVWGRKLDHDTRDE
ncbi:sam dependent methyltransferase [Coniochaeta sp. 2T2.1]|nr:sam dependent methyltransferase [Coniochaeta sp. 2T2.1]